MGVGASVLGSREMVRSDKRWHMILFAVKSLLLQVTQVSLLGKFLNSGGELGLTFGKTTPKFSNSRHCRIFRPYVQKDVEEQSILN